MTLPHSSWLYTMKLAEASLTQTDRSIVVLPVQAPVRNQHFFFSGQRTQDGKTPWGFIFSLARGQNLISVKGPQPRTEEGHGAVGLHNDSIRIYIYSCVDMWKGQRAQKSTGTAEDMMAQEAAKWNIAWCWSTAKWGSISIHFSITTIPWNFLRSLVFSCCDPLLFKIFPVTSNLGTPGPRHTNALVVGVTCTALGLVFEGRPVSLFSQTACRCRWGRWEIEHFGQWYCQY